MPHPVSSGVYSPGHTRSLFTSFRPPMDVDGDADQDRPVEAGDGKDVTVSRNPSLKVVRAGTGLGEVEMRELRVMRAQSPRRLRMISIGKRSDETIEMK